MVSARLLLGDGAACHGERLAVVSARGRATYADLDVRANRLAAALASHGVAPGDRVVVFMDNSLEAVVAMLGVLAAGMVLAPVDADTDAADLAFVFDDCRAAAVITEARLGPVAAEALRFARSVGLVILAGGDQGTVSETCLAFDDVVGRGAQGAVAPVAAQTGEHPLMLVYPRTPAGLAAPVTMTDGDVVPPIDRSRPGGVVIEGVRPMCGAKGVSSVLSAIAAGATMVLAPAGVPSLRRSQPATAA